MNEYVVGFMFDHQTGEVVLIRKEKPAWQKGYLNGVGGKVEPPETPAAAMVREFREETSHHTELRDWQRVIVMESPAVIVHFFMAEMELAREKCKSVTCEKLEFIYYPLIGNYQTIPNLQWIVPFCLHHEKNLDGFHVKTPLWIEERV